MDSLRKRSTRIALCVSLAALMVTQSGCFDTDFTYGKSADRSVNGLSVFANLLRDRGHSVSRKRRLTRRLDNFDTVVWAPDNTQLPPENVVAWFEGWLAKGSPKVLIYVGRSYDATLSYYQGKFESASAEKRDQWQRELAEQILQKRQFNFDWGIPTNADDPTPFWFQKEEAEEGTDDDQIRIDNSKIAGPWAENVDGNAIDLDCDDLLEPLDDYNDQTVVPSLSLPSENEDTDVEAYYGNENWDEGFRDEELTVKNLLTVDGRPFAFELSSSSRPNRKVIIVNNASFLLNYTLLNPENRKLASRVADEATGNVVFIESNSSWPRIGGSANDPALQWTWVGRAPMSYIVPHFLFWGVLYCFVFFPNFGRPKRVQFHPPKAFRSHVQAVASILSRSKEKSWARSMIDMWLKRNNKSN